MSAEWNPPYDDATAEYAAQIEWLNEHPDELPPWVDTDSPEPPPAAQPAPVAPKTSTSDAAPAIRARDLEPRIAPRRVEAVEPEPPPPPQRPLPEPIEGDTMTRHRHLCSGCSVRAFLPSYARTTRKPPLCARCDNLVRSGESLGPLAPWAIERDSSLCPMCKGYVALPTEDDSAMAWCAKHANAGRRSGVPLQFDSPQVAKPHGVGHADRGHFFF
jgi:hypothetical protein